MNLANNLTLKFHLGMKRIFSVGPFGGGAEKVFKIAKLPVSMNVYF